MTTSVNREWARDALAYLIDTALTTAALTQEVYNYQVGDFEGRSPVVVVTSGPVQRTMDSFGTCWRTNVTLYVHVFVLYSDKDTWGEDDAEDRLDAIEAEIADVVAANPSNVTWGGLEFAEPSIVDSLEIGGDEYRHEVFTVLATMFANATAYPIPVPSEYSLVFSEAKNSFYLAWL